MEEPTISVDLTPYELSLIINALWQPSKYSAADREDLAHKLVMKGAGK